MSSVDINLGLIFINALIFFILGLITDYLIDVNVTKIISKILYIGIILGMYWIFLSSPIGSTSEFADVMTKLVYYFVNSFLDSSFYFIWYPSPESDISFRMAHHI